MSFDINNVENLDEINNSKPYAKIPNNFFYDDGEVLNLIGGKNGFVLYCLLTSRKNMNNDIYMSIKDIANVLKFEKNLSRMKKTIIELLILLKDNKYISYDSDIENISINDIIRIKWVDKFPKLGGKGWTKFYSDDFEIHNKIGNVPYVVMWVMRMYTNFDTKTSFISITDIRGILECDRNKIQNSIKLFKLTELFDIKTGEYYEHSSYPNKIKMNNEYKYTGNIEILMNTDDKIIKEVLFPKTNKNIEEKIDELLG